MKNTQKIILSSFLKYLSKTFVKSIFLFRTLVAGAWTEREKMDHGGSFLKLADDNKYIKNPEAQNREVRGF